MLHEWHVSPVIRYGTRQEPRTEEAINEEVFSSKRPHLDNPLMVTSDLEREHTSEGEERPRRIEEAKMSSLNQVPTLPSNSDEVEGETDFFRGGTQEEERTDGRDGQEYSKSECSLPNQIKRERERELY